MDEQRGRAAARAQGLEPVGSFSTGQILTHFKVDICERLAHRIHHPNRMEIPSGGA